MAADKKWVHEGPAGTRVRVDGRGCDYFAGNNYLGLAGHPEVCEAAVKAVKRYGVNTAASRSTTGTALIHVELEASLARFKDTEEARVFAGGYLGNQILMAVLKDSVRHVFVDEAAHPSLFDAVPAHVADTVVFRHADVGHLEELIRWKEEKSIILTDGIFPLTGEIAPLPDYLQLAEDYNAVIIVDDAHATGVLGDQGRGTPEYFQCSGHPRIFQSETMSKALGVYGGFISGSAAFIQRIEDLASAYIGSTALSPVLAGAGLAAVRLLMHEPERRSRLLQNTARLKSGLQALGMETSAGPVPIVPVYTGTPEQAGSLSRFLKGHGIIAPYIAYPAKTRGPLVRITVSADHTEGQIDHLLKVLSLWKH